DSEPQKADLLMAPSGFAEIFSQDWFSDVEVPKGGNFSIEDFAEVMRQKKILPPENISDPKNGVFQTDTGEITMRANESLLKVATPRTEAVSLLAGKGEKIGALEVVSTSENAAIALSSLDGNPISKSSRMLLIFSTEDRNTGETFSNDGVVLLNRGRSPVRLRAAKLELLADLDKSKKFALYPLHSNGERRDKIASVSAAGGKAKISIDTAALKNGPTVFFELAEEK
ncbi:MAG: hypothetical protein IJI37_03720, partial [Opitutales bacterium]|nr:hypothetical protein [Opitutales bacterium]